jgi:hypothetical protein
MRPIWSGPIVVLALTVAAVGCGGAGRHEAEHEACMAHLGDLHQALRALDSGVQAGLSYRDYGNELRDVVAAYDNTDFSGLSAECLARVAVRLERALRQYQRAFGTWRACGCDTDAIEPSLRVCWERASTELRGADIGAERGF